MTAPPDGRQIGEILFVLGAPRSGTTLVSRLLLEYFDFGIGPEAHWIAPYAQRVPSYGDLEAPGNIERLIEDILGENMFQIVRDQYSDRFGWRIEITPAMVRAELPEPSYAGVVYAALSVLAQQVRRSRVGNKDPGFYRHLDTLHSLFPSRARYLCVVRDGRDVAVSMMKQPWGQKTWYANARLWSAVYERIEAFRKRIPTERFCELRYEDLLTDTHRTCSKLETFLGEPLDDASRKRLVEELTTGRRRHNFDKWKGRMTARDGRLYEAVAGDWLSHYGYERTCPDARAIWWERVGYDGLEYGRRAVRSLRHALGAGRADVPTSTHASAKGS